MKFRNISTLIYYFFTSLVGKATMLRFPFNKKITISKIEFKSFGYQKNPTFYGEWEVTPFTN